MLKVNVGVSGKLSKDYNSTGFTLNLEGEICAKLDEPEAVIERIREFYDLAEEALQDQIRRHEEVDAFAAREADGPSRPPQHANGNDNRRTAATPPAGERITRRQGEYLYSLGKTRGLTMVQLEAQIHTIIGRQTDVEGLTKQEAGEVIDAMLRTQPTNGKRSRTTANL